jgi:type IV secretion system protein VirB10
MADTNARDPETNVTGAASSSTSAHATDVRSATAARGTDALTDLHGSKIPADDPRLKLERPQSRRLKGGPPLIIAATLATAFGVAIIIGLTPTAAPSDDPKKTAEAEVNTSTPVPLPDVLRESPEPTPAAGARTASAQRTLSDTTSPQLRDDAPSPAGAQRFDTVHQAHAEEAAKARGASLFAQADDSSGIETTTAPQPTRNPSGPSEPIAEPSRGGPGVSDPSRPADANMQERKNDFLSRSGASSAEYLEKSVTAPRSPYEVKAGTVIPTVLITGINSDLPGQVVGQVRENVYDTVTGNYLLIPQGSRVIAAYDSMVAWGQERVLVCWNRIIRPDGSSISIDCMPGVDLGGYAGFTDEVDNHWWRIISGAALSSLLAATAQRSAGDVTNYQPTVAQAWAGNAAGQINQAGQQITARNMQIQPTITVRPGFSVNVLVSKDIVIPPYPRGGVR